MATAITPRTVNESELARGVRLQPVAGFEPPVAVATVSSPRPGTLRSAHSDHQLRWSWVRGEALRPRQHGLLPLEGGSGWLAVDVATHTTTSATRVRLEPAPAAGLQASLGPDELMVLDVDPPREGPLVVLATSMLGQPAVRLADTGAGQTSARDLTATAIARGAAAAMALPGSRPSLSVWLARPVNDSVEVRLEAHRPRAFDHRRAQWGQTSGELRTGAARALVLPAGRKLVRLTATRGVVAAVTTNESIESTHFGGDHALVESFETAGDTLWVQDCGLDGGSYAVELLPAADPDLAVASGAPFERRMTSAGSARLTVPPATTGDLRLHVRGAVADATLVRHDGQVLRGSTFELGSAPATLLLGHGPGTVIAWLGRPDEPEASLWDGALRPLSEPIVLPARIEVGEAVQALPLHSDGPALLELRSAAPLLFRLHGRGTDRSWLDLDGGLSHAVLAAGGGELVVRSVAGATAELALSATPITTIGEGLGREVLLAPGAGHAFSFTVDQTGKVGVGVRADSDTVDCTLLTSNGRPLGHGVVQMHELEAADYLLLVRLPADRQPVRARPAVVGIERPPTGPPEEVIRGYLERERRSP
jgi:hypothetical protein